MLLSAWVIQPSVIAGLDPAIPINVARPCLVKRDGRVEPGHDGSVGADYALAIVLLTFGLD